VYVDLSQSVQVISFHFFDFYAAVMVVVSYVLK
jgi:hypothetical protein